MKKTGIIAGGIVIVALLAAISPSKSDTPVESIELSVPNYQEEYDINTEFPIEVTILPEDADISSIKYIHDGNTLEFSDHGITTGSEEGTYEIYVTAGDVTSNAITINVVDIAAREELLLAKAEEERLAEEQAAKEAEKQRLAEEQAAKEAEAQASKDAEAQKNAEAPATQDANSQNNSAPSDNGSNFNTYDNASQQQTNDTYVLNTHTKKIHHPSCKSVKKIAPQNYSTSNSSIDELIGQGYSKCGNCF